MYDICYPSTGAHANVDGLSRVPLKVTDTAAQGQPQIFILQDHDQPLPVQATEVAAATRKDLQLSSLVVFSEWMASTGIGRFATLCKEAGRAID